MSPISPANPTTIKEAAARLRAGGLVIFPTETVYGIGALGLDALAVAQIFAAKERPRFNPLILHVLDASFAKPLVQELTPLAQELIARFWPGPLTLVLPKTSVVPEIVTGGLGAVALRCPAHPVARELIAEVGSPLAAPSANRFQGLSATRSGDLDPVLVSRVAMVLDGGPTQWGLESTIVGFSSEGKPELLRMGALARSEIETITGPLQTPTGSAIRAPGMLAKHYSPRTRLLVGQSPPSGAKVGYLKVVGKSTGRAEVERVLSEAGNLKVAASRLFETLQELDRLNLDFIVAELGPAEGLGEAINDRLLRASAP